MGDKHHIHDAPTSFWRKWVFSVDHKVIAKQFLWSGLIFLAIGGTLAMIIRWQWAFPGEPVPVVGGILFPESNGAVTPGSYPGIFTTHGLIMVFWAITPILIGAFGNYIIPLHIGARDMAFPLLNMLSFWVFFLSQLLVIASMVVPLGMAAAGWTTYPPLSSHVGTPGIGQSLMVLGLFVTGIATIMGAVNYIVTVIRFRTEGLGWMKLSLSVWGLWLTSILNLLFVPVLGSAGLLLLLDRHFGTTFFEVGSQGTGGDPLLFQHLFWIFGHPEVYILILPVWGFVGDVLAWFSRKRHFWYRGTVGAMISVTVISAVVYGHHMYQTGMNPVLGLSFEVLTLAISFPAVILFANWFMTIWRGSLRTNHVPMLFALGTVWVFGIGGLTGLALGTISTDIYLHDTMWVVGHFHLTMASSSFLGSFVAIYFWFPKMFGRRMNPTLGKIHFWGSVVFLTLVFGTQLLAGYQGQQRRLYDPFQYNFLAHLATLNRITSYSAFALAAFQLAFVVNFFRSVFAGEKCVENNPWECPTLEWTLPCPPPHYNFKEYPVVHQGPHEMGDPVVKKVLGRDWLGQHEEYPTEADAAAEPASA